MRAGTEPADQLRCHARRIANCTTETGIKNGYVVVNAPDGMEDSVEIVNCYFSKEVDFYGSKLRVENSVLSQVRFTGDEATFDAVRSCFWNHPTNRRGYADSCIGQRGVGKRQIHTTDCLFDTDLIIHTGEATWTGTRNLYRIHGMTWGVATIATEHKWVGTTLSEWRDTWKSDADSVSDESALLRPESWRQQ